MGTPYTSNIPQAGDHPADSQLQLLNNFTYLAGSIGKGLLRDHNMTLNTSNADDGMHKQVTFSIAQATPSLGVGVGEVYVKNVSGQGNELFYNNGVDYQLTGITNTSPTNGTTTLPGGIILKWGSVINPVPRTNTVVTFTTAFPGNCFSVTNSVQRTAHPTDPDVVYIQAISNTSFTYFTTSNSGDFQVLYWMAIGN